MSGKVNFADPGYEPTDEDLQQLAQEAFADVAVRHAHALARFRGHIAKLRAEVLERAASHAPPAVPEAG